MALPPFALSDLVNGNAFSDYRLSDARARFFLTHQDTKLSIREPVGWDGADWTLKRDDQYHGVNFEFTGEEATLKFREQAEIRVPEPTINDSDLYLAIIKTVDNYCKSRGYSIEDTWHYVYNRLLVQNGIDVRKLYRAQGANDLDALEKHGLLDKLWAIVSIDLK